LQSAFTVDVEDYFQVTAFDNVVDRSRWSGMPRRVADNTRRLLDLLARHEVQGTFFVLGWVAEHHPDLVREIDSAGHEIGSHSHWHRLVYELTPDAFRSDLRRSKETIEQIIGKPVTMYRAPTFSITDQSRWALEILVEEGFHIDSSIFPLSHHDRYGLPGIRPGIQEIKTASGSIWEAPMSVTRFLGRNLPLGGGGYFRLYPLALTMRLMRRVIARGLPVNFYIHPWEIDAHQPKQQGLSRTSRYRHYVNLSSTAAKLDHLLRRFPFTTLGNVVASARQKVAPQPA
jgi:polysaccharide deacetylase family protein (PEP-CTERM system associated)